MNSETEADVEIESEPLEPSWSRLVDRVRAGDPAGMEQLYAVFVKGVRFFLWRQLGPQDLDDKVPSRKVAHGGPPAGGGAHRQRRTRAAQPAVSIDPAMTLPDHQPDPERRVIEQESQDVALQLVERCCPSAIRRCWFASIYRSKRPKRSAATWT